MRRGCTDSCWQRGYAGAAEGQQTTENQETGNNGQTASETQERSRGTPVPDGMVASGGRYIDPNAPMVALTFDDGPYALVGKPHHGLRGA